MNLGAKLVRRRRIRATGDERRIMQNKANLPDAQMNISFVRTTNYEQLTMNNANQNKADTNPISKAKKRAAPIRVNYTLSNGAGDNDYNS